MGLKKLLLLPLVKEVLENQQRQVFISICRYFHIGAGSRKSNLGITIKWKPPISLVIYENMLSFVNLQYVVFQLNFVFYFNPTTKTFAR